MCLATTFSDRRDAKALLQRESRWLYAKIREMTRGRQSFIEQEDPTDTGAPSIDMLAQNNTQVHLVAGDF